MKNLKKTFTIFALLTLFVPFSVQAANQAAKVAPVSTALMASTREAVTNMQIIQIFIAGGKSSITTGDLAKTLTKAEKAKFPKLFEAEVKKASTRIIDRLAKSESQKFTPEQINDILVMSRGTFFKSVLTATINGKPSPDESTLPDSEREVFTRVGNSDYFKKFQDDVSSDGGNMKRDMTILVKRAFAKMKK